MKRGRDEDKVMSPLFPRLHVNDADRGGPRAPPRNKMALYEQLSIPSQKFNSGSLPLPLYGGGSSAASASSSQGGGHERSLFSPFYMHQSPSQLFDMAQSPPLIAKNSNFSRMELVKRSLGHANHISSNAVVTSTEFNSCLPRGFSNVKSSCEEKIDDQDDFMVPTFFHSDIAHPDKDRFLMETKTLTPLHANSPQKSCSAALNTSFRFRRSFNKSLDQEGADPESIIYERSHTEHKSKKAAIIKEQKEKFVYHFGTGEEVAASCPSASSDQGHTIHRDIVAKTHKKGVFVNLVSSDTMPEHESLYALHCVENEDILRVRNESCLDASHSSRRKPITGDNCNPVRNDKMCVSMELNDRDESDRVFETSMVDSISGLEISPDDVVGVIGTKQFWKARRAIVNQQRVFAVQVFELHRLIKVQKLIAASPYLLLEEHPYATGSPQKVPSKSLPTEFSEKPESQTAKGKEDPQKLNQTAESQSRTEDTLVPPHPSHDDGLHPVCHPLSLQPKCGPYTGNPPPSPPVSVAPDNNVTPWCYPPANHWLVPVIWPSEGLIYKSYPGPCPPSAGFMPPFYGSYGAVNPCPRDGDFMNTAYSAPTSHQQHNMTFLSGSLTIPPNYLPTPVSLPFVNTNLSSSAVDQVSPIMGRRPTMQIEQSSCNMNFPRSEVFSGRGEKVPTSNSELQGSTASSPFEKAQVGGGRDALPLFPTVPAAEGSDPPSESYGADHQPRVIKVVPHNARSATVSAARIFRSIQKERQHNET